MALNVKVYFWGLYSVPLAYLSVFKPPYCFWLLEFCLKIRYPISCIFDLCVKIALSGFLVLLFIFRVSLFFEEVHWYFGQDCIESVNQFKYYRYFSNINSYNLWPYNGFPYLLHSLQFLLSVSATLIVLFSPCIAFSCVILLFVGTVKSFLTWFLS